MSRSQILETLAALGAGAIILSGCGGQPEPAKGPDVPASATPSAAPAPSGQAAPADTGKTSAASPTPSATPSAAPSAMASAAPSAMPMAKDMPKSNKTVKVRDSKRTKACQGGCGAGTCGDC